MLNEKKMEFFKWKKYEYYQNNKVLNSSDINSLLTEILNNKQKYEKLIDLNTQEKESIYNEIIDKESMTLGWLNNIRNSKDIIQLYKESFPKDYIIEDINFLKHVTQDSSIVLYSSKNIKNDKKTILPLIRNDGYLLKFLKTNLKNDFDVCAAAIESNGINYLSLNEEMKSNNKIIELALKQEDNIFVGLSEDVKFNKDLILKTLNEKNAMIFWSEINISLKKDKEVINSFLTKNGSIYKLLVPEEQKDLLNIKNAIIGNGFNIINNIPKEVIMDNYLVSIILEYMIENKWFEKDSKFQYIQKELFFTENKVLEERLNYLIFKDTSQINMKEIYTDLSSYLKSISMHSEIKESSKKNKINKF